jgi:hypothetical protein
MTDVLKSIEEGENMYNVEFMNDIEFEALPYSEMENKVGVCDRNNRKIYVRSSGVKPLDSFNALHEIEHMEDGEWGRHADHQDKDRPGIYYKGFGDIFNTIAQAASFIPSPIQPAAAAYSTASGVKQAATGSNFFGGNKPQQPQQAPQASAMQSFKPQAPVTPQSNVIQPTGGGQGQGGGITGMNPSLVEKVRGYFGGRSPQEEFITQKQGANGFGQGNTSFSGSF